jgi:hypothetical protein
LHQGHITSGACAGEAVDGSDQLVFGAGHGGQAPGWLAATCAS